MDEDELSALTVAELKVRLKESGLTTSGKKADLIARLIESEDEGDVLILEDEEDEFPIEIETDDEEILEAEVFEAEIIDEEFLEPFLSTPRTTGPTRIREVPDFPKTTWYKDGTTIATILVVLLLAGAGGWWYLSNEAPVFKADPSRYGDDLQFTVSNGLLLADGDEMVGMLRDAIAPSALDDVCDELRIEFAGTGSSSITDGELTDLLDPSETKLKGAVMAQDAYGRTWNTVQSNLHYDLSADLSGFTWQAINEDRCSSSIQWSRINNDLDVTVTQWHEITERSLLRSETTLDFEDAEGQSFSTEATTFDGLIGSDTVSELVGAAVMPMHPVNLYDIFGVRELKEGMSDETDDGYWSWTVGSTSTIGGQDAIQIRMEHIKIGECLGHAVMILWAIPGQPLAAKQVVDVLIDKSKTESGCSFTESEAIDLTFPEGEFVVRYTLEQTSFKRGEEYLDWQTHYATRPDRSDNKPPTTERVSWATHMPDNSSTRFNLEQAVACVMTDAEAFGSAHAALNSDGYVFAAKDDRSGSSPVWNLSWVSSAEAGWVRVTWPGGENCLNSGDGQLSGDDKPEHSRDQIPQTHKLSSLESRMVSSTYYPDLHPQVTANGVIRDDVQIGYALVVPEENAVSEWLDEFDIMGGKVTVYLERTWTSGDTEHSLRVGMDAETGRMAGWVLASTPA